MISEAGHYTTFIWLLLANTAKSIDVDKTLGQELVEFEAEVIKNYGKEETIHG